MKKTLFLVALFVSSSVVHAEHSILFGAHYFYALEDIKNDIDIGDNWHRDGVGFNAGYQFKPNDHLGLQLEVQGYPDGYHDAKSSYSTRILGLIGRSIFFGAGVAWNHVKWEDVTHELHEEDGWSDQYYLLRGGMEFSILTDDLKLGLKADYEFNEWNDVRAFQSNTLTFGAYLRLIL